MVENQLTPIQTHKEAFIIDYPQAEEFANKQLTILWFAKELGVELDKDDILTKCTEGERHGITTVLRLFTIYEVKLGGEEFWGGKVSRMFPRHEIVAMASTFSMVERQVHAYFYDLINKTLNIATEEFYTSYKKDPILSSRVAFVDSWGRSNDPLRSMAAFCFMEGVVLFSNFAYLKSFNAGGYNMIPHITAGIDASAKDENFHSIASAWLFNTLLSEKLEAGHISQEDIKNLQEDICKIARTVYEHEERIVEMIFEKGGIRTVSEKDILSFIRHRIDVVLNYLQMEPLYNEGEGVISEWFYSALSAFKYSDFFAATQTQYVRTWDRNKLVFG